MNIVMIGLNHKTAPLEVRERVSFASDRMRSYYEELLGYAAISECLILSTCNRVELYGVGSDPDSVEAALKDMLLRTHGVRAEELDGHLYAKRELEAVAHFFRVAAGLDSMVIGESQIVQQIRKARDVAASFGAAGEYIKSMVADSLQAGIKVRSRTGVSKGVTSVPAAAVRLIKEEAGSEKKKILVVGAGKIGKMTIAKLADIPDKEIVLMNRDKSRAQEAGDRHNVTVKDFSSLEVELSSADIVVAATASDKYLIDRAMVEKSVSGVGREMTLVDLGVPRNIDESVRQVKGVKLYNIDDLKPVVDEVIRNRTNEAAKAEKIVRAEAEARYAVYSLMDAQPVACGR